MQDFGLVTKVILLNDKKSFGLLVDKYQQPIRRLLLKLTQGNKALSDDLAQDTFIKAYLNIASFKATATFGTWLYRIAYNEYLGYLRKNSPLQQDVIFTEPHEMPNHDSVIDVETALAYLRHEERLCICLSYMEGLPHGDIATITGMPIGTIKTHIARGKEKLRTLLKR